MKRLFSRGMIYEQLFSKIVGTGCDTEILGWLLCRVCTLAVGGQTKFLDLSAVSTAQRNRLVRDLLSLADLVERINHTTLNPKFDLLAAPADSARDPIRKQMASLYDKLPFIMRVYSVHLGRFSTFSKALLKRMSMAHIETVRLLVYVEESTGSPRYEDMSNLLTGGFLAAGGSENTIPEFFSTDALGKLKQRTAKFRLTARF